MALCAVCTLLIPETKGRTLDEIEHGVLYGERSPSPSAGLSAGLGGEENYDSRSGLGAGAGRPGHNIWGDGRGGGDASPVLDGRMSVRPKWNGDVDKGVERVSADAGVGVGMGVGVYEEKEI
jgi:hypothetical protein